MSQAKKFEEYQFLGYNRFATSRRLIVSLFCFVFYFVTDNPEDPSRDLFFYLGVIVLIITVAAMFIPHCTTKIENGELKMVGPVSFRSVAISLAGADNAEIVNYSRFLLNRPVFNLHRKNVIRFFTYGNKAVQFTTAKGETIRLGTQRPEALLASIQQNSME